MNKKFSVQPLMNEAIGMYNLLGLGRFYLRKENVDPDFHFSSPEQRSGRAVGTPV